MLFMLSRSAAQLSRSAAQLLSLSTVYVVVLLGAKAQEPPEPATAGHGGYPGRWIFTKGNDHICPLCPAPATGLLQGLCCKGYAAGAMLQGLCCRGYAAGAMLHRLRRQAGVT